MAGWMATDAKESGEVKKRGERFSDSKMKPDNDICPQS
jgi:hypothetical protein